MFASQNWGGWEGLEGDWQSRFASRISSLGKPKKCTTGAIHVDKKEYRVFVLSIPPSRDINVSNTTGVMGRYGDICWMYWSGPRYPANTLLTVAPLPRPIYGNRQRLRPVEENYPARASKMILFSVFASSSFKLNYGNLLARSSFRVKWPQLELPGERQS